MTTNTHSEDEMTTATQEPLKQAAEVLNALEDRQLTVPRGGTVMPPMIKREDGPALTVVETTQDVADLFGAMAEAQGEFTDVERTLTAKIKSKREGGADYTYDYAPLDEVLKAVRPALSKHGIAVMQFPQTKAGFVLVRTMITHKSGQWMRGDLVVGCNSTDPKDIGSAITYARRYALMAMLGIAPDHDDDGGAEQVQPRKAAPPREPDPKASAPAGDERCMVLTVRPFTRGTKTVWCAKTTTGDVWLDDESLKNVAEAAVRAEKAVAIRTEQRKGAKDQVFRWVTEILQ